MPSASRRRARSRSRRWSVPTVTAGVRVRELKSRQATGGPPAPAMFAHVPGLQVVMPATPADAKGLLMTALTTETPVVCLEHRWLYERSGPVGEEPYYTPLGHAAVVHEGRDVTVAGLSLMVGEA